MHQHLPRLALCQTAQRLSAVEDDHVAQGHGSIHWRAGLGAIQLRVGTMQVTDNPLGIRQVGEGAEVRLARRL